MFGVWGARASFIVLYVFRLLNPTEMYYEGGAGNADIEIVNRCVGEKDIRVLMLGMRSVGIDLKL